MKLTDEERIDLILRSYRNDFLAHAILEDYAVRMAKLDGIAAAKTFEKITRITSEKLGEHLKNLSKRKLPEKVKILKEIKTAYTLAACLKLQIPYETANFDTKKLLVEIDSKAAVIGETLRRFFATYRSYRYNYVELKKHGRGSFSHYQTLEAEMNVQRDAVDKLIQ